MPSSLRSSAIHKLITLCSLFYAIFSCTILNATDSHSFSPPILIGRVVDEAGILNPQTTEKIIALSKTLEHKTSIQFVVVVLKSLQEHSIEDYGINLARHWKIGQQDKNNGLLLILAPNEREVRLEVGYGLEGELTDALSKKILEKTIIPYLKENDPNQALLKGAEVITQLFIDPEEFKNTIKSESSMDSIGIYIFIIIFFFFLFVVRRSKRKQRGNFWGGGFGRGGKDDGNFRGGGGGFGGGGGGFGGGGASGRF